MGEMPKNWPAAFGKRASQNLDLVLERGTNNVTQIVLTLYALVVVPEEKDVFASIQDLTQDQMMEQGWEVGDWHWKCDRPNIRNPAGLQAFLRMLRNALSHGDIKFIGDGENIVALSFTHRLRKNEIRGEWTIQQSLITCRKILALIESVRV